MKDHVTNVTIKFDTLRFPNLPNNVKIMEQLVILYTDDGQFREKRKIYLEENKIKLSGILEDVDFTFDCFEQVWEGENLAFDKEDGRIHNPGFRKAYTTIVTEINTGVKFVFVGDKHCYTIYNPTDKFHEDQVFHKMTTQSTAKELYEKDENIDIYYTEII